MIIKKDRLFKYYVETLMIYLHKMKIKSNIAKFFKKMVLPALHTLDT